MISREEIESLFDNRNKDVTLYSDDQREDAIKDLTSFIDKLKLSKPTITKDEIKEKIKCYFDAPF